MVVQEDDEAPVEATITKRSKYLLVKNHIRELSENLNSCEKLSKEAVSEKSNKVKSKKLQRKRKSQEAFPPNSDSTHISDSDLDELKTIYNKCKAVLLKIKSKYGHLLDLNEKCKNTKRPKYTSEESGNEDCSCSRNKKIIFDENGEQIVKECQLENHICPKRKRIEYDTQPQSPAVQVEYNNVSVNLPDSLQELEQILKDPNIDDMYRKMVIDKVYLIRQGYLSEMRYERDSLIKQLKERPDELLDFKGTNLSSLPGYPTKPLEKIV